MEQWPIIKVDKSATEDSVESILENGRKEIIEESLRDLEDKKNIFEKISATNNQLENDAENLPERKKATILKKIEGLKRRANEAYQNYGVRQLAIMKVFALASVPIFFASNTGMDYETQEPMQIEQLQNNREGLTRIISRAKGELQTNGITSEQKEAYQPIINDALYNGINTHYYSDYSNKAKKFIPNIIFGRTKNQGSLEDAYRFYLGLPQEHETFGVSGYQPTTAKEQKYYYKINGFFENLMVKNYKGNGKEMIMDVLKKISGNERFNDNNLNQVMGHYKMGQGIDEQGAYIAYYDKWDLDAIKFERQDGFFGKPYELYDRIYYNPDTLEPIYDKEMVEKVMDKWLGKHKQADEK